MLTPRQNFIETITGGTPDRFVKQFEALSFTVDPITMGILRILQPGETFVDGWGVTWIFPDNVPGQFPLQDEEHLVLKDISQWRDVIKAPRYKYSEEEWAPYMDMISKIDRKQTLVTSMLVPGLFENLHMFMGMEEAFMAYYTDPEYVHEIIDFCLDFNLKALEELCNHVHPDVLFLGDDLGGRYKTFLSAQMMEEFYLEPFTKLHQFAKEHGVKYIVRHSDSYCANLIPLFIKSGVDVYQAALSSNNVPELVKQYGGQISFMGDLDNQKLDVIDWTPELIHNEVRRACTENGKLYFIPCLCSGGPGSIYPGVAECIDEAIDEMSKEMF